MRPLLRPAEEPDGEIIWRGGPAEVTVEPGAHRMPCETVAWHRLVDSRRQDPHRWVEWLVKIRFEGHEAWYEYSGVTLRGAKEDDERASSPE